MSRLCLLLLFSKYCCQKVGRYYHPPSGAQGAKGLIITSQNQCSWFFEIFSFFNKFKIWKWIWSEVKIIMTEKGVCIKNVLNHGLRYLILSRIVEKSTSHFLIYISLLVYILVWYMLYSFVIIKSSYKLSHIKVPFFKNDTVLN